MATQAGAGNLSLLSDFSQDQVRKKLSQTAVTIEAKQPHALTIPGIIGEYFHKL
jgi:hypothetical protein